MRLAVVALLMGAWLALSAPIGPVTMASPIASPIATPEPFISPIGTPVPTAIQLRAFNAH